MVHLKGQNMVLMAIKHAASIDLEMVSTTHELITFLFFYTRFSLPSTSTGDKPRNYHKIVLT